MSVPVAVLLAAALVAVIGGLLLGRLAARRQAEMFHAAVRSVTDAVRAAARAEAGETVRSAELTARQEARGELTAAEEACRALDVALSAREARAAVREAEADAASAEVAAGRQRIADAKKRIDAPTQAARADRRRVEELERERLGALERQAGESADAVRASVVEAELDEARAAAAQTLRLVEQSVSDPDQTRRSKRLLGIAVARFSGHYLTERLLSSVPLPAGAAAEAVVGREEANLRAIEEVAGVKLAISETQDAVRLEGLDGFGREVARRSLASLSRNPRGTGDPAAVTRMARQIASQLDREVTELGRRAFNSLKLPPAHADIVKLVGRLNYRTSYTQNQWKHAVEAAFLCGMIADELGLDVAIARRAALMHDIGKALTHELDGSHAVIGADIARRLGEPEIIANAIGAHHADEPFASPYAYLVAAADAMSGARPGARRQMEDNYIARLEDLHRIVRGFRGIEEAFAVHGGREVRIYVQQDRVDDLGAVSLSTDVARKISSEMTFPGQIRVTVIREFKAIETAS